MFPKDKPYKIKGLQSRAKNHRCVCCGNQAIFYHHILSKNICWIDRWYNVYPMCINCHPNLMHGNFDKLKAIISEYRPKTARKLISRLENKYEVLGRYRKESIDY